ncbi:hypothetical protein CDD83_6720 [Cordyceps sp. RAO-2017]|nr:hypothetical protein CDD83_6720 [Cordyceps sp. RAO-2017]
MDELVGSSSPEARRHVIDRFLASLTPWDVLHLRARLREGKVTVQGLASLADLPGELVDLIAQHLHVEDVLSCRLVCRSWLRAWDGEHVSSTLCRHFFPGLLQSGVKTPARDLFLPTAGRFLRRHVAQPVQKTFIPWDASWSSSVFQNRHPSKNVPSLAQLDSSPFYGHSLNDPVLYKDGKLAWQVDLARVIVDDLYTHKRQFCSTGPSLVMSAHRLVLKAVTGHLLIFVSYRADVLYGPFSNMVQVWHLGLEQWRKVHLPAPFAYCYAADDRVAFVTSQEHVISWSWAGKATELDVERHLKPPAAERGRGHRLPGVIWHPTRRNELFVVRTYCLDTPSKPPSPPLPPDIPAACVIRVLQYQDGQLEGQFEKSFSAWAYNSSGRLETRNFLGNGRFCQQLDAHGLHWVGILDESEDPGSKAGSNMYSALPVRLTVVGFNVLTRSFTKRRYMSSYHQHAVVFRGQRMALVAHGTVWDDQLVGVLGVSMADGEMPDTPQVTCFLAREARTALDNTVRCEQELGGYIDSLRAYRMFSDQDFFLLATEHGILVWTFLQEPKLSSIKDIASD